MSPTNYGLSGAKALGFLQQIINTLNNILFFHHLHILINIIVVIIIINQERRTYVVAHEEVVSVGSVATDAKEFDKIMELTVNITTDSHWTFDRLNVPFLHKDRSGLLTQCFHFRFS
jgi:hypothetical protein